MRYESPTRVDDAVKLLAEESGSAKVLAGGTDLLVGLRSGRMEPDLVVDIKRIDEMCEIVPEDGGYRVGAAVPSAAMGEHEGLSGLWPGVVEAAGLIGSTQVQSRATMAGNLCNGSPAADSVPAMVAARAVASIVGPNGRRELPVEEVVTGPGRTALEKGEIVASIFLPTRPERSGDAYLRFIPRTEMDIAVAGVAVNLSLSEDGTISDARIALGAVAARVVVADEAAKALIGTKADDDAMERMAEAVSAACSPIDDKRGTREYRIKVAGVLAKRAAAIALERARG